MDEKLSFHIENFRNIIDVNIDIWPDKINFIVGDNNIGKSNILKAIETMCLQNNPKNKFIWGDDTPSISGNSKGDEPNTTKISVNYDLPEDYVLNKFKKINIKPIDLEKLKNKFIKNFSYCCTSEKKTNGLNSSYVPLFEDEELEKTYAKNISDIRDELINDTYPDFKIINGDDNLENDNEINFSYQQLLNENDLGYFKLIEFLCAFASNDEQVFEWLELLKDIKSPIQSNLTGEPLQRYRNEINSKKAKFKNEINENIANLYKNFSNLHCKLVIDLTETNNINISIKTNENYKLHALSYKLQGKGVKKLINLIYWLQFSKITKKKCVFLIDEIEESLSINSQLSLLCYLKDFLKDNKNVYFVIVTHAPSFFNLKENEKYSDYMYFNLCSQNNDGSINVENINPDSVILENAGYEAKNGKNAFDGVRFLSIALDMPDSFSKKVIDN